MSRFTTASSTLASLSEKLSTYDTDAKGMSIQERRQLLESLRTTFDDLAPNVNKMISKAELGEQNPAKRTYGPEMTAKIRGLAKDMEQAANRIEKFEEEFKVVWGEFEAEQTKREKDEAERREREEKETKERQENEEREKKEREEREKEAKERARREEEERLKKVRDEMEKVRKDREEQAKRVEELKRKEEEEKSKKEEMERIEREERERVEKESAMAQGIRLSIKTTKSGTFVLENVPKNCTIKDLKQIIHTQEGIAEAAQRLIYQGRLLADGKTITDCKIVDGSAVHLVEKAIAATTANTASNATVSSAEWKPLVPPGTLHELTGGKAEFDKIIENCGERRLLVVDWSASWCGPCKMIAPVFGRLASRFADVTFVKVDTEQTPQNAQLAAEKAISAYPTLHFYVGGRIVHQFSGASGARIEAGIKKGRMIVANGAGPSGGTAGASSARGTQPLSTRVLTALTHLKNNCPTQDFVVAVRTLLTFVKNVVDHPGEEKYRRVRTSNNTFHTRLGSKSGGMACMEAFGFERVQESGEDYLVLTAAAAVNPDLPVVRRQLEQALAAVGATDTSQSQSQTQTPSIGPGDGQGNAGGLGGIPGFGGMAGGFPGGGMGGGMPNFDPALLNEFMNDPTFMQLAAEMGTDSSLQAALLEAQAAMQTGDMATMQRLMNNPAMTRITQAMINNPIMMNALRRQHGDFPGMGMPGMFGGAQGNTGGRDMGTTGANAQQGQDPGANTEVRNPGPQPPAPPYIPGAPTTAEEEDRLLQEAIRLSMQDQAKSSQQDGEEKEDQGDGQG